MPVRQKTPLQRQSIRGSAKLAVSPQRNDAMALRPDWLPNLYNLCQTVARMAPATASHKERQILHVPIKVSETYHLPLAISAGSEARIETQPGGLEVADKSAPQLASPPTCPPPQSVLSLFEQKRLPAKTRLHTQMQKLPPSPEKGWLKPHATAHRLSSSKPAAPNGMAGRPESAKYQQRPRLEMR